MTKVWHKNDLPPHNIQVLNEYDCVVTYNYFTKNMEKSKRKEDLAKGMEIQG